MNISYNWLKKYINIDLPAEEVSEILTSIGLEVGSVEKRESIRGGLAGLVVGKVLTCENHPNSDHLHVTTVDVGNQVLDIVCGASNVAAGQKVIVATPGTVLYDGDKSFTIKPTKLRGVTSNGMICAEDEIGVGTDHSGIIVLPENTAVGTPAREYYNVETDTIFEVDITPNRADAASHYGVARDLVAAISLYRNDIFLTRPSVSDFDVDEHLSSIEIKVENTQSCPRYSGVPIYGVTIKPSPDWLRNALISIGLTPINNVVDVTNFILHAFGQPLHAFDASKIKGNRIVVKNCPSGTKFTTLDGKERELHQDDLMICNDEEPMCLAGIFGGLDSGISETTTKVFIESAWFDPVSIRKSARRHGLSTDASFRYERGTDPNITIYALKYAALLIKEVAGGKIAGSIRDAYPAEVQPFTVEFNIENCNRLIGKNLGKDIIRKILRSLEIEIASENGNDLVLKVPRYRVDVTREADVIEDILRIYGYNNIETPQEVHSTIVYAPRPDTTKLTNIIANQLVAQGFQEIMCNTLTKSAYFDSDSFPAEKTVLLANPLSSDLNALRQTLLFGALESVRHNRNRKNPDLKFFEIGNCQRFLGGDKTDLKNYAEKTKLSLLMTGLRAEMNWNTPAQEVSYFDLKTALNSLFLRLGINQNSLTETPLSDDIFAEGAQVQTNGRNENLLKYGLISRQITAKFDIDSPVYYAEIDLEKLIALSDKQNKSSFAELPKFPEVKRDLALLIDQSITFAQLREIALKTEKKLLKSINLFDVYEGKNLPQGKKSYAVSFTLRDDEKTLEDKQIDRIMTALMDAYKKDLGAEIR